MTQLEISKEQVAALPTAVFPGKTIVIDNPVDCRKATRFLATQTALGFDTETRPTFHKGQRHNVALIQISTLDECFLFRINRTGLTDDLVALFENPSVRKIGLSIKDDLHGLHKLRGFEEQNMVELQTFVKQFGILDNSLQKVYGVVFGERISKGQRLTNWEAAALTPDQQHYAALDAYACLRMYLELTSGSFIPENSPYITDKE